MQHKWEREEMLRAFQQENLKVRDHFGNMRRGEDNINMDLNAGLRAG
jgi:hypothetical protein